MPKRVVFEEYHITVLVPRGLPEVEAEAIRRALTNPIFDGKLHRAVRRVFRREVSLVKVRVRLSR